MTLTIAVSAPPLAQLFRRLIALMERPHGMRGDIPQTRVTPVQADFVPSVSIPGVQALVTDESDDLQFATWEDAEWQ